MAYIFYIVFNIILYKTVCLVYIEFECVRMEDCRPTYTQWQT